jgi:hypothetical protein
MGLFLAHQTSESARCVTTGRPLSSAPCQRRGTWVQCMACEYKHVKHQPIPRALRCSSKEHINGNLSFSRPPPRGSTRRDARRKRGAPMNTHNETLEKVLRGLATAIRFVEDLNGILSSVFISLALILAVMSLITGGALLQAVPWSLWIWAGALAVGVEATLVSAFDRTHQAWIEARKLAAAAWATLGIMLAIVSFCAVTAFTLSQSLHIDEATALRMMGLSPLAFDLGRSLITVLLACIAGLARPRKKPVTHQDRMRELQEAIAIEPLKQQLESLRTRGKARRTPPTPPQLPTGPGTPAQMPTRGDAESAQTPQVLRLAGPDEPGRRRVARAKMTLRDKVFRALDEADGNLSKTDLAKRFRASPSRCSELKKEWTQARSQASIYAQ